MRSMKACRLSGGVTRVESAAPKNDPKRPRASTRVSDPRPIASNGRSARGRAASGIERLAIDPECPERKVLRVEMVLEHEDAGKSRAVPEGIIPRAIALLG